MTKALVTGGAGFIGSHLAEALCRRGARVVVLDDFSSGSKRNLDWHKSGDDLEVIEGDVRDEHLVRKAIEKSDWVFHQAAMVSVPFSISHPEASEQINNFATLKLLIAARDAGVQRFMFASSSAVYGDAGKLPVREDHPVSPISPYGLQKYSAERYAALFHQLYGLPTVSFRYFNVFGPRQSAHSPYSGVIARFCSAALEGSTPTVFGDGQQSRDFTFISNVVSANLLAAEAPADRVAGKAFNVGGGGSVSLLQLIDELETIIGRPWHARHEAARLGDIRFSSADIASAREAFAYEVAVDWRQGLRETYEFYRAHPA